MIDCNVLAIRFVVVCNSSKERNKNKETCILLQNHTVLGLCCQEPISV